MYRHKPPNFILKIGHTKMYKIYRDDKRYNNKVFSSYEEARKYVRRKITQLIGCYVDSISYEGFSIRSS